MYTAVLFKMYLYIKYIYVVCVTCDIEIQVQLTNLTHISVDIDTIKIGVR